SEPVFIDGRQRGKRPRGRRAAERCNELAPFRPIRLHPIPTRARQCAQDIELAKISQDILERLYNPFCPRRGRSTSATDQNKKNSHCAKRVRFTRAKRTSRNSG